MSLDVEQLARCVQRVSLSHPSRKTHFQIPSLGEEVEDVPSVSSDEDVDMSDACHAAHAIIVPSKDAGTETGSLSQRVSTGKSESGAQDTSTASCETSTVSLRRGGKGSLGLVQELMSLIRALLIPSAWFVLSQASGLSGRVGTCARVLGKVYFIVVPIVQITRIWKLMACISFRPDLAAHTIHKRSSRRRRHISRANVTLRGWDISAVDRIDNFICKFLVWLVLVVARTCILLLCIAFFAFSTLDDKTFIPAGIWDLNFLAKTLLVVDYQGALNTQTDATILQECKTLPELVFENQHMCN